MMGIFYISAIILILVSLMYIASFWITAINTGNVEKLSAYECGFEPVGDARMKFEILYYIVGLLYLIFDLEVIFLFPLATILFSFNNLFAFWIVNFFFIIVSIGLLYELHMGALDFDTHHTVPPVNAPLKLYWICITFMLSILLFS